LFPFSITFYEQFFHPQHTLYDIGKAQKLSGGIAHPVAAICCRINGGGGAAVVRGQPAGSYLQDNGGSIKLYTPAEV